MASSEHLEKIRASFSQQAQSFESKRMNFSKQEYLHASIRGMEPRLEDEALEVACGTALCSRTLAPFVHTVTCLDATPAMLQVGRQKAEKQQLKNLIFLQGEAEQLPFADASFDLVFSRLAMHHFAQMEPPFWEMVRVLRPGGRLAIIDMQAAPEPLREREDHLETLRDPSHVKNRSLEELLALFKAGGIQPVKQDTTPIAVSLQAWLELTKTPPQICQEIQEALEVELSGGPQTGFEPFVKDGALHFWQRWLFLLGKKQ